MDNNPLHHILQNLLENVFIHKFEDFLNYNLIMSKASTYKGKLEIYFSICKEYNWSGPASVVGVLTGIKLIEKTCA